MIVGFAGIILSIIAIAMERARLTSARANLFLLLLALHVAAAVYYYHWSLTVPSDARGYFFDPYGEANAPWGFGAVFVSKLCRILRGLGADYLGATLLFQTFGFAGLMIMARVFTEIQQKALVPETPAYLALLFLPSANFWTSMVGKDGPMFFAIALSSWAMLGRRRILHFCAGVAIMVLFRPYIAAVAVCALAATAAIGKWVSFGKKLGILAVAVVAFIAISGAVLSTFKFDATSVSSVNSFLKTQDISNANTAGTTSLGNLSIPMRIVSLLFRPFFFDARDVMGLVASVENVGVLVAFLYVLIHWKDLWRLASRVPFVRFCVIFAAMVLGTLTLVYYNVGLGLRERVMAYPMIYSILVAVWSVRRNLRAQRLSHASGLSGIYAKSSATPAASTANLTVNYDRR